MRTETNSVHSTKWYAAKIYGIVRLLYYRLERPWEAYNEVDFMDTTITENWTWGEWVAYIEGLQREFATLFPPTECVMFPEAGEGK